MNNKPNIKKYDVVVAKEYEVIVDGKIEKKTKWNQVGTAWDAKNGRSLVFELFMLPGTRYLVSMKAKDHAVAEQETESEETPF